MKTLKRTQVKRIKYFESSRINLIILKQMTIWSIILIIFLFEKKNKSLILNNKKTARNN